MEVITNYKYFSLTRTVWNGLRGLFFKTSYCRD
jgi:hypothetical protein